MSKKFEYQTYLVKSTQLGLFADFPFESAKIFGTRKAIRVIATFDGKMYRMKLLPHGNGTHWLHIRKEIREAIGKNEGDLVTICIEKDETLPTLEIPEHLQWLLENEPEMMRTFEKLSFSTKKFWIDFVQEPKSDDTKVLRINRFFEFLREQNSGKNMI